MIEKVFVDAFVHRAVGIKKVHMLAQPHGVRKSMYQVFDDHFLLGTETHRICWIHRGEIPRLKRMRDPVQRDRIIVPIDLFKEQAILHTIFRMPLDQLPFQFEDQDRDRFFERVHALFLGIGLLSEQYQIAHTDAVAVLQNLVVAVFNVIVDADEDAGRIACRGAHPQDIVIAPLYIQLVLIIHQKIHDQIRVLSPVKYISENVQTVHSQPLCQSTERHNEIVRALRVHNGIQDLGVIESAVVILIFLRVQQLVNDEGEFLRHSPAHLGTGIF